MVIVIVVKDDDPVQLRMDDIYDHSFVSTIQHHVHHISNSGVDKIVGSLPTIARCENTKVTSKKCAEDGTRMPTDQNQKIKNQEKKMCGR
jgi:hypothetical protein